MELSVLFSVLFETPFALFALSIFNETEELGTKDRTKGAETERKRNATATSEAKTVGVRRCLEPTRRTSGRKKKLSKRR